MLSYWFAVSERGLITVQKLHAPKISENREYPHEC
jgi:hypothetical protein